VLGAWTSRRLREVTRKPKAHKGHNQSASSHPRHHAKAITKSQTALTTSRHKDSSTAPLLETRDKWSFSQRNSKHEKVRKAGPPEGRTILGRQAKRHCKLQATLAHRCKDIPSVPYLTLLEPSDPRATLQTTLHYEPEEDDKLEFEQILDKRGNGYLVKWRQREKYSSY